MGILDLHVIFLGSQDLDVFSWWFFFGFDPMGFITIFHHHLREYFVHCPSIDVKANPSDTVWYVGLSPFPVTVTTRIIVFLVGDPYKL